MVYGLVCFSSVITSGQIDHYKTDHFFLFFFVSHADFHLIDICIYVT